MRNKWKGNTGDGNESDSSCELQGNEKDRQPRLTNLTPEYDLKLFMEAQAIASEKIVSWEVLLSNSTFYTYELYNVFSYRRKNWKN